MNVSRNTETSAAGNNGGQEHSIREKWNIAACKQKSGHVLTITRLHLGVSREGEDCGYVWWRKNSRHACNISSTFALFCSVYNNGDGNAVKAGAEFPDAYMQSLLLDES